MLMRLTSFVLNAMRYRGMIIALAVKEFRGRFGGTLLGATWSFIHPLTITLIFWVVFSIGFKAMGPSGTPFVVYFLTGFLPWTMFNESLSKSANVVIANSHLVKNTVFPTEILPLSQILTSAFGHFILLPITIGLILAHGHEPSFWMLQVFYYFCCMVVLALGLSLLFAALNVFYRDAAEVLGTILNFWFWMTPLVWNIEMIPERYRFLVLFNPMHYIVEGYRNALLYQRPFWNEPTSTLVFWAIAIAIMLLGTYVFQRLKPQFADVL